MARKKKETLLTRRELAVMNVIWDSEEKSLTIREVVERMNEEATKPIAYTTVQTLMGILKDKGVLLAKSGKGRAQIYRPCVTRDHVRTSMVGDLVERLFDGQAETLMAGLVEQKSLDKDDLKALRRLIDTQLGEEDEE